MSNVTVNLEVPEEKQAAVLAAVASALAPEEEATAATPTAGAWSDLAEQAVAAIRGAAELRLLGRVAQALGQRVSMSELSRDLGLPAAPSLEHDFQELQAFCAEDPASRPFPVLSGGDDGDGWYCMAWLDANAFVWAFEGSGRGSDDKPDSGEPIE
jgi:hypothetical protein